MSPTVEAIEERVMMNCVYYTYFMGCSKKRTPLIPYFEHPVFIVELYQYLRGNEAVWASGSGDTLD